MRRYMLLFSIFMCMYRACGAFQACFQLRMNIVETPADEDAEYTGRTGRVKSYVPPSSRIRRDIRIIIYLVYAYIYLV